MDTDHIFLAEDSIICRVEIAASWMCDPLRCPVQSRTKTLKHDSSSVKMYVLITNNECSAAVETIRRADGKTTVMLSFLEPAIRKEAVVIHSALISKP